MTIPAYDLSERERQADERTAGKRALVEWLRAEAAARDGEMAWYVVRTKWRADSVAGELEAGGIEVICPKERRWRRFPRSTHRYSVDYPMFGNYLFVRLLKAESAWVGLLTFKGVDCLQGSGETPVPLGADDMAQILALLEKAGGATVRDGRALAVGDKVLHPLGHFAELEGTVVEVDDARRRVLVRAMLFGREIETRCGIDYLEKLA